MRATPAEARWLERLAPKVQKDLQQSSPASLETAGHDLTAARTDRTSDGWYVNIANVVGTGATLAVFIDGDHPQNGRRAFWYGASDETRAGIMSIRAATAYRWPRVQQAKGYRFPLDFRHEDPWLQKYNVAEYYYGWTEQESPATGVVPSASLRRRVSERLTALLFEIEDAQQMLAIDGDVDDLERVGTVRREQAQLRTKLFGPRQSAKCDFCGVTLPIDLLVAAHTKRRSDCTFDERRDLRGNILALCTFGCDAMFERGYLVVTRRGLKKGPRFHHGDAIEARIAAILAASRAVWNPRRAKYLSAHSAYHRKRAAALKGSRA
jgi:hypothetical protein